MNIKGKIPTIALVAAGIAAASGAVLAVKASGDAEVRAQQKLTHAAEGRALSYASDANRLGGLVSEREAEINRYVAIIRASNQFAQHPDETSYDMVLKACSALQPGDVKPWECSAGDTNKPAAFLPECPQEDSKNCIWHADESGNGKGTTFVDINGIAYYPEETS